MCSTKPISLTLVLLLAFWMPAAVCCGATAAHADEGGPAADAAEAAAPPCHGEAEAPAPDEPPVPEPCDDHECTCDSPMLSACREQAAEAKVLPASSSHLLGSLLAWAPLQPQTLLPHTFFARPGTLEDTLPPPLPAPTLLALSCQLIL